MDRAIFFALVHVVALAGAVGEIAPAGPGARADQSALATAEKTADKSATRGGAADNLSGGVVTLVGAILLAFGAMVRLHLCKGVKGRKSEDGNKSEGTAVNGFHRVPQSLSFVNAHRG